MALSAHEFIRALKGSSDPPRPGGPSKVELAQATWDDPASYIPNKAELITDWILALLLKERGKQQQINPILDSRYWSLLHDILHPKRNQTVSSTLKTWLPQLLTRIPLVPIITTFLSLITISPTFSAQPTPSACLSILWPFASPKITTEALLDAFGAVLSYLPTVTPEASCLEGEPPTLRLCLQITSSLSNSFENSSHKRRISTTFLENCLLPWVRCIPTPERGSSARLQLLSDIYDIGIKILFNIETLRFNLANHGEPSLEEALTKHSAQFPTLVLEILPRLFSSFIEITRKHRGALFAQGSNLASTSNSDQAKSASMRFFSACEAVLSRHTGVHVTLRWTIRIALVDLVDAEALYDTRDEGSSIALRSIARNAVESLPDHAADREVEDLVLSVLSTLTHIDYDLVSSPLQVVLPKLVVTSCSPEVPLKYLGHLLNYHVKTRTLDVYTLAALDAFSSQKDLQESSALRARYQDASSGPLLNHVHLAQLSKAIISFTTPGQVFSLAENTINHLVSALDRCRDASVPQKKSRKKRTSELAPLDNAALEYSLVAGMASIILTSLPLDSISPDTLLDIQRLVGELYSSKLISAITVSAKAIQGSDNASIWGLQIATTASLRLRFSLAQCSQLSLTLEKNDTLTSGLLSIAKTEDDLLPELVVESIRSLLLEVQEGRFDPTSAFEAVLIHLERSPVLENVSWNGELHKLNEDSNTSQTLIVIFYLVAGRFLTEFSKCATRPECERFAKFMSNIDLDGEFSSAKGLTLPAILINTLQNAQFWELDALRMAFFSQISEQTSHLDSIDVTKLLDNSKKKRSKLTRDELPQLRASFQRLLYAPPECMSRMDRQVFLRRAIGADVALGSSAKLDTRDFNTLLILREFVKRLTSFAGGNELPNTLYVEYLMDSPLTTASEVPEISSVTLELLSLYFSALKSSSEKETTLLSMIQSFFISPFASGQVPFSRDLRVRSFVLFVDILTAKSRSADFGEQVTGALRDCYERLTTILEPRLVSLVSLGTPPDQLAASVDILELWCRLTILRQWSLTSDSEPSLFGRRIAIKLLKDIVNGKKEHAAVYSAILSILLVELRLLEIDREVHLDLIVASYVCFSGTTPEAIGDLDTRISQIISTLSISDFQKLLDLISDGISRPGLNIQQLGTLVHLSNVIFSNAPEGTLKSIQGHFAQSLSQFVQQRKFSEDPFLRMSALVLISKHFNDRPAAIRAVDVSNTWTLLGTCLANSTDHDKDTQPAVYREIVAIVSALIRLRRDLLLPNLPHLGMTLRRLMICLKALPPYIGGKQARMVSNSLPSWINTSTTLGPEEGRAVARLLTTLTTKTIPRTFKPTTEIQKSESLARPFSKHASVVLAAYIEVLNDPLCMLSADVRKELEPGLFAVCDIMGEQNRDALMVTLDSSGKTLMKAIWREYGKQRYVGKG